MLALLRTVWNARRDRFANRPSAARPRVEELEDRALPSSFASLLHLPGQGEIKADLVRVNANVQSLTRALGSNTSTAVSGDLKTLQSDLTTLSKDVQAGNPITADIATLLADQTQLAKDLGTGLTPRVQSQLANLDRSLLKLSGDLAQSGPSLPGAKGHGEDEGTEGGGQAGAAGTFGRTLATARDIRSDLADVKSDVQALTTALGSNVSSAVSADLKAIQTDLTTLANDIAAGTGITKDLNTLVTDEGKLVTDLAGTTLSSAAQRQLNDLTSDLKGVAGDVTQFTNGLNSQLTNVQNDLTKLEGQLGTLSGAAATDLTALEAAVTTLANDLSAGTPILSDVTTVLKDELTLINDLGLPLPAGSQATLLTLARDVAGLGLSSIL
jgi:hypothetical protein